MTPLQAALLLVLLISSSQAQDGAVKGTASGSRQLQPWLVGLTAVVVFLFIVFLLMIVNRVLCYKKHRDETDTQGQQTDTSPGRLTLNVYENPVLEEQPEEGAKANKTTSL